MQFAQTQLLKIRNAAFSRVRKLIILIAHHYMQFAQTQLFKFAMQLKRDKHNN